MYSCKVTTNFWLFSENGRVVENNERLQDELEVERTAPISSTSKENDGKPMKRLFVYNRLGTMFELQKDLKWKEAQTLPGRTPGCLEAHKYVLIGHRLLITGGMRRLRKVQNMASNWIYHVTTGEFEKISSLRQARRAHALHYTQGDRHAYVVGGLAF